jgi:putative ABC transport system permease protein
MAPFKRVPRILRGRADILTDVDDEIAAHLEATTNALIATGLDPDAARAEARRRFGDVATTRRVMTSSAMRQHGRIRRRDRLDAFAFDLRYSLRQLRRAPGFSASVIVTLGLGLGANAAMFGLLDRLLLRPPAHVREAEQVRRVYLHIPDGTREALVTEVSYRRLTELQQGAADVIDLAGVIQTTFIAGEGEEAREIRGALASSNFFPMLGVRPHLGRFPREGVEGAQDLVLGFEWWRSAHGSDSAVIGRTIRIGTGAFTVVGIAPEAFTGIDIAQVDAWLPALAASAIWTHLPPTWPNEHSFSWLSIAGRLRDGASQDQAEELIGAAYRRSLETQGGPDAAGASRSGARLYPVLLQRGPERNDDTKVAIWLGVVAFIVLLLACTNVANLLLARAVDRQGEVAVRIALGVGRSRLVRQLLMETAILAAAGAAAGLVLAQLTDRALRVSLLGGVGLAERSLDGRTIVFAILMAILACGLSGLGPSWFATRTDVRAMLSAAGRGIRRSSRFRTALLVSQTALSTVLLIGAGLFVRSLLTAQSTRLGYDADRLIIMTLRDRSRERGPGSGMSPVYRELAVRARAVPGVVATATTMQVPFAISGGTYIDVPGIDSVERLGQFRLNGVGDGYFETAGTRIIRGRALTREDRKGTPLVMVVSDSMARTLWPGRDAIGQCVKVGGPTFPCSEVVGVAENVHQYEIRQESSLQYWFPESQEQGNNSGAFGVLVRVDGDPVSLAPVLRRALLPGLPGTAHLTVRPLGTSVARAMRPWRLGATMFTAFGALGLLIATVGLFSALAYAVSQRRREFGVRVALGARSSGIVRMVLGQGLRMAIIGVAIGVAIAMAAGGRLAPLLLGVGPRDPVVTIGVALALGLTATLAGLIPAWRASRVDPADALRSE